jgi:hypothetical protein
MSRVRQPYCPVKHVVPKTMECRVLPVAHRTSRVSHVRCCLSRLDYLGKWQVNKPTGSPLQVPIRTQANPFTSRELPWVSEVVFDFLEGGNPEQAASMNS